MICFNIYIIFIKVNKFRDLLNKELEESINTCAEIEENLKNVKYYNNND